MIVGVLALVCLGFGATEGAGMRSVMDAAAISVARSPLHVVGLGDSVPAGSACNCSDFVQLAAATLAHERGRVPQVANDAVSGYTSADVVSQLSDAGVRRDLAAADVVVIEVGANDFDEQQAYDSGCLDAPSSGCFDSTMGTMSTNLTTVVKAAKALNPRARIALVGYWNVFRDGQVGAAEGSTYVAASDSLTKWVNSVIRGVATKQLVAYVDAYSALKETAGDVSDYLVDDGDHPNSDGHALLAAAVVAAVDR